jgi:acetyl-CoA carboxylase biotin carboxyl carrier protein
MTIEEIKELVQIVITSGVAELEVTRGENAVRIRRSDAVRAQEFFVPSFSASAAAPVAHHPVQVASAAPEAKTPPEAAPADSLHYVRAPIVGTFYEAPAPDAAPFIRVGDRVSPGQVLCIIESMKLMNEIEAEVSGTIEAKLVENEHPVEYGEALFAVRPD